MADGFSVFGILAADPDWPVTILDVGVFSDVSSAAAAAHNQAREQFLAIVVVGISVRHNLSLAGAAAGDFLLDSPERLPVNDCFMAVFDIDFAELSRVYPFLFGAEILTEGLLQQQVTGIFFVKS